MPRTDQIAALRHIDGVGLSKGHGGRGTGNRSATVVRFNQQYRVGR